MNLFFTCIKIFFARILDVSLNTVRTTFVIRGKTLIVALIAFFEITIWFLVARTALNTELNIFIVLSYSGGYTTGTIIGTIISKYLVKTNIELLVISNKIRSVKSIKDNDFGVTILSKNSDKIVLFIQTTKKRQKELTKLIEYLDDKAFISIKETRSIINGYI